MLAGLGVGAYFLFAGDDSTTSTTGNSPRGVTNRFYRAAEKGDTATIDSLFCSGDVKAGALKSLDLSDRHVTSWSITGVRQEGDKALVTTRVTTRERGTNTGHIPLVAQSGSWKICFTAASSVPGSGGSSAGNAPVPVPSLPSISIPSISLPSIPIPSIPSLPGSS